MLCLSHCVCVDVHLRVGGGEGGSVYVYLAVGVCEHTYVHVCGAMCVV